MDNSLSIYFILIQEEETNERETSICQIWSIDA